MYIQINRPKTCYSCIPKLSGAHFKTHNFHVASRCVNSYFIAGYHHFSRDVPKGISFRLMSIMSPFINERGSEYREEDIESCRRMFGEGHSNREYEWFDFTIVCHQNNDRRVRAKYRILERYLRTGIRIEYFNGMFSNGYQCTKLAEKSKAGYGSLVNNRFL